MSWGSEVVKVGISGRDIPGRGRACAKAQSPGRMRHQDPASRVSVTTELERGRTEEFRGANRGGIAEPGVEPRI